MSDVLIVGAGIGGLALAAGLKRRGVAVTVVERAAAFRLVGAGISLQPNATAVLAALGIVIPDEAAAVMGPASFADVSGRSLMAADTRSIVPADAPAWNVHRADLHQALLDACEGVEVRLGVAVTGLEERGEAVEVQFADGTSEVYPLVIGADGLRSTVREALGGGPAVRYSGQTCWRFAIPSSVRREASVEIWASETRAGMIQLSQDRIYCYLVASAPEGTAGPGSSALSVLIERFGGLHADLDTLLSELTPETPIHHGDLCDLDGITWGRGRVLLMGDASHGAQPNMGQGAAMAIEDAGTLSMLVPEKMGEPEALRAALRAVREARVKEIQSMSWRIGQAAHWKNPLVRAVRDLALRVMPIGMMLKAAQDSWEPGIAIAGSLRGL